MGVLEAITAILDGPSQEGSAGSLRSAVEQALPDAETETHAIVTAVAGLLCTVAYADGVYHPAEAEQIRRELGRIEGMTADGLDTLVAYLDSHLKQIAVSGDQRWVRDLKDHASKALRSEVLEVLVELAAADGHLDQQEVAQLRRLAMGLGLGQEVYNSIQARHRDKLRKR